MLSIHRLLVSQVASLLLLGSWASAQGAATSSSTVHVLDSSTNIVWLGGTNDTINGPAPIPIDLDISGGPWKKSINTDLIAGFGGGIIEMRETIQNVDAEPWTDWREEILNVGIHFGVWDRYVCNAHQRISYYLQ